MLDQIKMVSLISLNGKGTKKVLFKQKYFIKHKKNHLVDSTFEHLNFIKAKRAIIIQKVTVTSTLPTKLK